MQCTTICRSCLECCYSYVFLLLMWHLIKLNYSLLLLVLFRPTKSNSKILPINTHLRDERFEIVLRHLLLLLPQQPYWCCYHFAPIPFVIVSVHLLRFRVAHSMRIMTVTFFLIENKFLGHFSGCSTLYDI